jgi:hypothetical protein
MVVLGAVAGLQDGELAVVGGAGRQGQAGREATEKGEGGTASWHVVLLVVGG